MCPKLLILKRFAIFAFSPKILLCTIISRINVCLKGYRHIFAVLS